MLKFGNLLIGVIFLSPLAQAREQLGQLKVDNLILRPQFRLTEPAFGDFEIGESLFAVRWEMDTQISAVFAVGSESLLGTSRHFAEEVNETIGFVEAYGQYEFDYGRIRAGLQPVGFGLDGNLHESDLSLPRSLIFQERLSSLRDIGVSYAIDYNHFFTQLMVHNGESNTNTDGRLWYTANWGWMLPGRWRIGFAGQTGTTKPDSTELSNDNLAGVDPLRPAQWRMGGPFVLWTPHNWRVAFEGYMGEVLQDEKETKFSAGYLLLSYVTSWWSVDFRYDQFDPNHDLDGNLQSQVSLGLGLISERRTSRLYLVGTKVFEEGHQIPNDILRLIWHLTPQLPAATPEW